MLDWLFANLGMLLMALLVFSALLAWSYFEIEKQNARTAYEENIFNANLEKVLAND